MREDSNYYELQTLRALDLASEQVPLHMDDALHIALKRAEVYARLTLAAVIAENKPESLFEEIFGETNEKV